MNRILTAFLAVAGLAVLGLAYFQAQREPEPGPSGDGNYGDAVNALERQEGLFPLYLDHGGGRVLDSLPAPDENTRVCTRILYLPYLSTGLGSNPVGLDRGRGGTPLVLRFEERGGRILAVAENTRFTARTEDVYEAKAVAESFARSIVWAGTVKARGSDGSVLVDITDFLTRDAVDAADALADQGGHRLAGDLSLVDTRAALSFPDNLEFDAHLTFTSGTPGDEVQATAPAPKSVTLTVHHSFVRLPDDGFRPRPADPRMGLIGVALSDYAADLDEPITRDYARRYRLEKTDPGAERSPVRKPIVFYVDRGAPEPVRSALVEGASWWAEAFEEAGFEDAYRVELLPEGVHPLDVRYNVIQWVHRQTRGWSYGNGVIDPRTGEVVKSVITLGSLRLRQDRRIFEGLLGAEKTGSGGPDDPIELSLARVRQLSAHEVGHGLGFPHNMAGSTYDGRASVMDYPAPLVRPRSDGTLDVSHAYAVGIGSWDKVTTEYLYTEFPEGTDEAAALDAMVGQAYAAGHVFVSDSHSRPLGAAHPSGSLWDNGSDPVEALEEAMKVRRIALENFGLRNLPEGTPVSELSEVIVPIYLYHRYQIEAAAKLVGGLNFTYSVKADGREETESVSDRDQRRALAALLATLDPTDLALPDSVLKLLQPAHRISWGTPRYSREQFRSSGYPAFDHIEAATVAAGLTIDALLHPERISRLALVQGRNELSVDGLLVELTARLLDFSRPEGGDIRAIREAVAYRYVDGLAGLAKSEGLAPQVASRVEAHMEELALSLEKEEQSGPALARRLRRLLDPAGALKAEPASPPRTPPGSPIGMNSRNDCWHCVPPERR